MDTCAVNIGIVPVVFLEDWYIWKASDDQSAMAGFNGTRDIDFPHFLGRPNVRVVITITLFDTVSFWSRHGTLMQFDGDFTLLHTISELLRGSAVDALVHGTNLHSSKE